MLATSAPAARPRPLSRELHEERCPRLAARTPQVLQASRLCVSTTAPSGPWIETSSLGPPSYPKALEATEMGRSDPPTWTVTESPSGTRPYTETAFGLRDIKSTPPLAAICTELHTYEPVCASLMVRQTPSAPGTTHACLPLIFSTRAWVGSSWYFATSVPDSVRCSASPVGSEIAEASLFPKPSRSPRHRRYILPSLVWVRRSLLHFPQPRTTGR